MPSASEMAATAVNPGVFASRRAPNLKSWRNVIARLCADVRPRASARSWPCWRVQPGSRDRKRIDRRTTFVRCSEQSPHMRQWIHRVSIAAALGLLVAQPAICQEAAAAALGNPDEPVRQHHRARAEEHARSTQPRRALQAEPGAVADAAAVQPADRDAAVDVPVRLVLGRIHLHLRPGARNLQPHQRELRAALRRARADDRPRARKPGRRPTSDRSTTPSRARTCGSARSTSTSSTPTVAAGFRTAPRSATAACSIPRSRATSSRPRWRST